MYRMTEQDRQGIILLHKTMEEFCPGVLPRRSSTGNAPVFGEIPADRHVYSR